MKIKGARKPAADDFWEKRILRCCAVFLRADAIAAEDELGKQILALKPRLPHLIKPCP
jgi:hypothetical protein